MYHYTDGGLRNVWLANGYTIHKTPYGEAVAIADHDGLVAAICDALARKPKPLTGTELRFIRTSGLLLSQAALDSQLGADAQSVARWEKSGRVPKMADKLIRLLYLEHANGNLRLRSAFETLRAIERAMAAPSAKMVMAQTDGHQWMAQRERVAEVI